MRPPRCSCCGMFWPSLGAAAAAAGAGDRPAKLLEAARRGGNVRTTSAMAVVEAPPPLAPMLDVDEEKMAVEEDVAMLSSAARSSRWGLGRAPVSPPPVLLSTLVPVSLGVVVAVDAAAAIPDGLEVRVCSRPAKCCLDLRRRTLPLLLLLLLLPL